MQKAKKEDFKAEEELRSQKAKYEETSEDVYRRMQDVSTFQLVISDLGAQNRGRSKRPKRTALLISERSSMLNSSTTTAAAMCCYS